METGQTQTQEQIEQEPLPGMEMLELIEAMSPADRIEYKRQLLDQISDRETLVHAINRVNEAEGLDVEIIY